MDANSAWAQRSPVSMRSPALQKRQGWSAAGEFGALRRILVNNPRRRD